MRSIHGSDLGVSAINATQVAVNFNQAVDLVTGSVATNYEIDGVAANAVKLSDDKKTATLTLATNLTSTATNYVISVENVKNAEGTVIEDFSKVYSLKDDVRPTIGNIVWKNSSTIEFTVSEPVDETTVGVTSDINDFIAVYDANGIKVNTTTDATYNATTGKVSVDVSAYGTGNYTLRVVGLEDFAGNLVSPNPVSKTFTISADKVAPTVTSIENIGINSATPAGVIAVNFSEEIDQTGAAEFVVEVDGVADTGAVITDLGDGKSFVAELPSIASAGSHKITVKTFTDLASNAGTAKSQIIAVKATTPTVKSAEYVTTSTGNVVVIKFNRDIDEATLANLTSVSISSDSVESSTAITTSELSVADIDNDGIDELVIDADAVALPGGTHKINLVAGLVTDVAGQANKAETISFAVPETSTTTPETVIGYVQSGKEVTVTFSAPVGSSALKLDNYTVEGQKVFEKAVFTSSTKDEVKLTLKADAILENASYAVSVSNVLDSKGKAVKAYNATEALTETVTPKLAKIAIADHVTVTATFTEAVDAGATVDEDDYIVKVNGVVVATTAVTSSDVTTITLSTPLEANDTVTVTTSDDFDGEDANGNIGLAGQSKSVKWIVE